MLDGAVGVFCAVGGVEPQSETVWRQADRYHVPRVAFINKMDRVGANFAGVVDQIRNKLGANPAPVQIPLGSEEEFAGVIDLVRLKAYHYTRKRSAPSTTRKRSPKLYRAEVEEYRERLFETVAETSDELLDTYLAEGTLSEDQVIEGLRIGTIAGLLVPVLCGSAFKNKGRAATARCGRGLSPFTRGHSSDRGLHSRRRKGQQLCVRADDDEPFSALVFKIMTDPFVGQLSFVRIYSGTWQPEPR